MLTLHFDFSDLESLFARAATFMGDETMRIAAPVVINQIRKDVTQGRGYDGPWSGEARHYKEAQKQRRQKADLQTETVDLKFTGAYLEGLHQDERSIVPAQGKEGQAEGLNKYRPHLGASQKAIEEVEAAIVAGFEKAP